MMRLLNSSLVGIEIPTPAATNFVIVNGTYRKIAGTVSKLTDFDGKKCFKYT